MTPTTTERTDMPLIYRLLPEERRTALEAFVGDVVVVEFTRLRAADLTEAVVGVLVGVAEPLTGAQADEAVLRTRDGLVTVSLATVAAVTGADDWAARRRAAERRDLVDRAHERADAARKLRTADRDGVVGQ